MRVNGDSGFHDNCQWCLIHQPVYNDNREAIMTITSYSSDKILAHDGDVKALDT